MVPESVTRNGWPSSLSIRTHMNHGGSFMGSPPPQHGPRQALQLGLDVTKASQNVLRLLESSHGIHNYSAHYQDTSSPCWHNSCGLRWSFDGNSSDNGQWVARPPYDSGSSATVAALDWIPTISWVQFSDDRTALAKLQAMDGSYRYISLLRLDNTTTNHFPSPSSLMLANDGWVIVREVACPIGSTGKASHQSSSSDMISLIQCLQDYLNIEHGGGIDDYTKAKKQLFAPQASLLTVGMAPSDQMPTDWSAPVGTLLEIPLDTYLEGVKTQTPHHPSSRYQDAIVQIDMTTTTTGGGGEDVAAAAAIVRVGNGARTLVFVDHLLLGKQGKSGWKILSKTFSPQLWEDDDLSEATNTSASSSQSEHHDHSHGHGHCHHHDHGSK